MNFDENKFSVQVMQERFQQYGACPVATAIDKIGGKWKPVILYMLAHGISRFSEMMRMINGINKTMLTAQLRALEKDGLINRHVFAEVPPRVEYTLTDLGKTLRPVLMMICEWSEENLLKKNETQLH
jgi:DNA-binding HxlR family transcriptional regulator